MSDVLKGRIESLDIRVEGDHVLLLQNGKLIANLPWEAALATAKALTIQGKRAEEQTKAGQIVMDQAILARAGSQLGLTNRWDLRNAASREAAWNSALRRYMPSVPSIGSREIFGTPTLTQDRRVK